MIIPIYRKDNTAEKADKDSDYTNMLLLHPTIVWRVNRSFKRKIWFWDTM